MSSNSVLNAVQHYQRSIEKSPADVARLLHCVGKLYKIPITVEHLQQTGVGRTVNALRKHDGELGVAAEAVVNKWKQLVAAESDIRAGNQSSDDEPDVDNDDDGNAEKHQESINCNEAVKNQSIEHITPKDISHSHSTNKNQHERTKDDNENRKDTSKNHHKSTSSSQKDHEHHSHHNREHRDKSKGHHSSKDSHKKDEREHKSHKSHSESEGREKSENKKEKHGKDEHKSKTETSKTENSKKHASSKDKVEHHSSHEKHKHHEKHHGSRDKDKSKSKSNSEQKSQSSSPSKTITLVAEPSVDEPSTSKKIPSTGKKRRHENEEEKEKGNSPKKPKSNLHHNEKQTMQNSDNKEGDMEDGIDSSMGANFADVLGMLNMPQKKTKKSLNVLKNASPKSTKKNLESSSTNSSSSKINGIHSTEMPSSSKSTSQRKLEKKPELLNSKVKLPPLDPSIALELPIISNNYKPMPLNPTVMDCVFNSATSSSSRAPPPRSLTDAEAYSHGISSKTMRTKVYSGVRTGQLLQVPSLFDLCIRVLQKNIDALEYTGGVPFDVLRSVLERATPQQLFTFEEYNPYLMEDSDVLWKQHVSRNYRGHKREEMESWREMFMRCQEDQERRLSMLAENIKQSQKAIALPVRKTQLAFVDSMVKPPRNVVRKQEQFGTKSKLVATPAARVAALCNVTPNAAKQGDARLRVAAAFAQEPTKLSNAGIRPKKAPLMAKTLQFMRGRLKR